MPDALRMSGMTSSLLVPHMSTCRDPAGQVDEWARTLMVSERSFSTSRMPCTQSPSPAQWWCWRH